MINAAIFGIILTNVSVCSATGQMNEPNSAPELVKLVSRTSRLEQVIEEKLSAFDFVGALETQEELISTQNDILRISAITLKDRSDVTQRILAHTTLRYKLAELQARARPRALFTQGMLDRIDEIENKQPGLGQSFVLTALENLGCDYKTTLATRRALQLGLQVEIDMINMEKSQLFKMVSDISCEAYVKAKAAPGEGALISTNEQQQSEPDLLWLARTLLRWAAEDEAIARDRDNIQLPLPPAIDLKAMSDAELDAECEALLHDHAPNPPACYADTRRKKLQELVADCRRNLARERCLIGAIRLLDAGADNKYYIAKLMLMAQHYHRKAQRLLADGKKLK